MLECVVVCEGVRCWNVWWCVKVCDVRMCGGV